MQFALRRRDPSRGALRLPRRPNSPAGSPGSGRPSAAWSVSRQIFRQTVRRFLPYGVPGALANEERATHAARSWSVQPVVADGSRIGNFSALWRRTIRLPGRTIVWLLSGAFAAPPRSPPRRPAGLTPLQPWACAEKSAWLGRVHRPSFGWPFEDTRARRARCSTRDKCAPDPLEIRLVSRLRAAPADLPRAIRRPSRAGAAGAPRLRATARATNGPFRPPA